MSSQLRRVLSVVLLVGTALLTTFVWSNATVGAVTLQSVQWNKCLRVRRASGVRLCVVRYDTNGYRFYIEGLAPSSDVSVRQGIATLIFVADSQGKFGSAPGRAPRFDGSYAFGPATYTPAITLVVKATSGRSTRFVLPAR